MNRFIVILKDRMKTCLIIFLKLFLNQSVLLLCVVSDLGGHSDLGKNMKT